MALISKNIQIEFADARIRAVDAIHDIRKAAESASLNLYSRYDVQLQYPMLADNDRVIVEIKIPDSIVNEFAIGNHLRGISNYLLKRCNGRYNQYVVGKRLLNYFELPNIQERTEGTIPMVDRLEAVAKFARLMQRSDPEALDYICRINVILEEVEKAWMRY